MSATQNQGESSKAYLTNSTPVLIFDSVMSDNPCVLRVGGLGSHVPEHTQEFS